MNIDKGIWGSPSGVQGHSPGRGLDTKSLADPRGPIRPWSLYYGFRGREGWSLSPRQ